jgi:alkylation response protein AidB-like acyl-CoA dehydrogenase
LGKEGQSFLITIKNFNTSRPGVAAQALGIAQGAFELALKYASEREQFGRAIGTFQVNAFKLADMATEIELARLLLYKACWLCEQHRSFSKESAMAKMYASDVAMKVAVDALQIFGGYGYMSEYEVERFYRDARITEIYEGTREIQKNAIASAVIGKRG